MSEVIELTTSRGPVELALDVERLDGGRYRILNKGIRQRRQTLIDPESFFDFRAIDTGAIVEATEANDILGEFR